MNFNKTNKYVKKTSTTFDIKYTNYSRHKNIKMTDKVLTIIINSNKVKSF